ncbi:MAG TPA: tRNA (adenosine(37)-N6)-dimethylallyltransferase MiaA [Cyanobacteria bacterium UBA8530]|nr:tRNA (adenosine(37)-N6)-dimethylallyltransferase MiaA [Cyanobacteria bacterium UBA8530]
MENKNKEKIFLLVLGGATASGKTALAIELAKRHRGTIISADSRQIYREFDIGTAKATKKEQEVVPHRLIDFLEPSEKFTLAEYQRKAKQEIEETWASGRMPILTGGTGLYLRSVVGGLEIPEVPPDPAFREEIRKAENLHQRLLEVDPVAAGRIHENDQVRIVRALEVHHFTGKRISELQKKKECPYRFLYLAIEEEREVLYARIEKRTEKMIEMGLVEEVKGIVEKHGFELPLLRTLGYAEIVSFLKKEVSLGEAVSLIQKNTRNYAKRQLTWFRHEEEIIWVKGGSPERADELLIDERSKKS